MLVFARPGVLLGGRQRGSPSLLAQTATVLPALGRSWRRLSCAAQQGGPAEAAADRPAKSAKAKKAVAELKQALQGTQADPSYVDGANFLRSIGLSNPAEVARVLDIATNPNSLFVQYNDPKRSKNASARPLDVEADMKPVVEFLRSRGVSDADVVKLIVGHPPLLSYNVPARLQPFWEYLAAVGCKDVAGVIAKRPSLLGLDVNDNLKKIVEYLQSTGTAPELIVEYIEKSI